MKKLMPLPLLLLACATLQFGSGDLWDMADPDSIQGITKTVVLLGGATGTSCSQSALEATAQALKSHHYSVIEPEQLNQRSVSSFIDPQDHHRIGRLCYALNIDGLWLVDIMECDIELGITLKYSIIDKAGKQLASCTLHHDAFTITKSESEYSFLGDRTQTRSHIRFSLEGIVEAMADSVVKKYMDQIRP